jgi:hypothetical protein
MDETSLIAYNWENLIIALSFVLFMGIVLTIGYLSRNIEDAVAFMLIITAPVFLLYILSALL